ncbi:MAG: 1-acyl-sn-glycerol-3-phosphate acyltransferase [bacterium]|nr:1-acyl-sn-glycerol-3-phosphate acyltransferase [bacterium]
MPQDRQHDRFGALKRAIRQCNVVITVGLYTASMPFAYGMFAVLCFLWRKDERRRAQRLQRVTAFAYRSMHRWLTWLRITRFDHRQPLSGLPSGPCVVIANHPTLMDITSITAVLGSGTTVVKPALYRRRMIGPLLVGAGHVEGPGADPISTGRVVDEVVRRLAWGMPAIIFPEGTRSPPGGFQRFGRLAFEVACRARVPLVSLTVRCEPVYLSKEVPLFRPAHPTPRLGLGVLAVDDPAVVDHDSRRLRQLAEERYHSWLRELVPPSDRAYDPAAEEPECQIRSKTV